MNSRRTAAVAALIPAVLLSGATAYAAESPATSSTPAETSAGTSVPPTATPGTPSCVREFFEDECVYFDITGLPRRVDAGDGWHEFTITVGNRLSTTMDDVDVTLIKQVNDLTPVMPGGDQNSVDLQARDRSSGQWREVGFPQPNIVANHYVTTDLVDGKPLTILLRVRVARDFPFTVTDGDHIGGVYIVVRTRRAASGRPDTRWEGSLWSGFSVFKPGTHTGETTSSPTPNGGSTPAGGGATPTGDALAETGSSSDLALLAGAGGAALAVCAGAVYAARRRRRTGA